MRRKLESCKFSPNFKFSLLHSQIFATLLVPQNLTTNDQVDGKYEKSGRHESAR